MKKFFLYAVIIGLFCSVCTSCSTDPKETDRPVTTVTDAPYQDTVINIYRPPHDSLDKFEDSMGWQEYVKEFYGIEFALNYISPLYQSGISTGDYYPGAIESGDIAGLIELKVDDYPNIPILIKEGLIIPLEDYLANNEAFMGLPPAVRDSFLMDDGHIWALPSSSMAGIGARFINPLWLDNLGYDAPVTVDELYKISKAFAYDDPNGNGVNDEYGMCLNLSTGVRNLYDIFLANKCYVSVYGSTTIGFDYSTGAFEEAALKPGMLESLTYIKSMHDEGILYMSNDWAFLDSPKTGNIYDFSNFMPWDHRIQSWTKAYTLSQEEKSIIALKPRMCFVMSSNTENPEYAINSFVSTFYGDIRGNATGALGIPDKSFTMNQNQLSHHFQYSTFDGDSNFIENNIALVQPHYNMIRESGLDFDSSYYTDDLIDFNVAKSSVINDFYSRNMLFSDTFMLPHDDYFNIQFAFRRALYHSFFFEIDTIDPEEFIKIYIENQKKAGAEQILQDINEKFGFSSTFSY